MSMTEASSQYFKDVASEWDNISSGYFGQAVRESAIAKAYLHRSMVVADVGAGTGFITTGLAPLVRRVYVVDGSQDMLEVARKNLSEFDNVEFHHADGQQLPFPDESLDAVFANMYLHHCPDPLAAIREMVRVLRPGGRLVITDMEPHPHEWLKAEMADVWQGFERGQLRGWYGQAGLVNVLVECTGQSCCATSKSGAEDQACSSSECSTIDKGAGTAKISVFLATGTKRMTVREAVQDAYSAYAKSGSCGCSSSASAETSCCSSSAPASSSSCCSSHPESPALSIGYTDADLSAVPSEAAEIPLGCGNPVAIANLKAGEVVVDIGSGGGLDSFLAAGKVGPNGQVIGVDMTPAMLERARAAAERAGIDNVTFRQGYAESLPVDDASADVILSNCVINLTEDKGKVFREAYRVLRSGGRLEISDIVAGDGLPIEARENSGAWSECVTGALPEGEYLNLISQAGFIDIRVLRSPSSGEFDGVPIYSAIVSARKL
jgi:arsenite methyltransferase